MLENLQVILERSGKLVPNNGRMKHSTAPLCLLCRDGLYREVYPSDLRDAVNAWDTRDEIEDSPLFVVGIRDGYHSKTSTSVSDLLRDAALVVLEAL